MLLRAPSPEPRYGTIGSSFRRQPAASIATVVAAPTVPPTGGVLARNKLAGGPLRAPLTAATKWARLGPQPEVGVRHPIAKGRSATARPLEAAGPLVPVRTAATRRTPVRLA